jgi:hypothetical protein
MSARSIVLWVLLCSSVVAKKKELVGEVEGREKGEGIMGACQSKRTIGDELIDPGGRPCVLCRQPC